MAQLDPFQLMVDTDREMRRADVDRPLYPLSEVRPEFVYTSDNITILEYQYNNTNSVRNKETRSNVIIDHFKTHHSILTDLDWNGMVLAGGSLVRQVLMGSGHGGEDLDFFFYGHSEASAAELLHRNLQLICQFYESRSQPVTISRNKYTVTVKVKVEDEDDYKYTKEYQFILRIWDTKADIIYGFDIGCCQILWDGGPTIFVSALAKSAFSTSCLVLDPSHNSPTYIKRLAKYFKLGFHIAIPLSSDEIDEIEPNLGSGNRDPMEHQYDTSDFIYDFRHLRRLWQGGEEIVPLGFTQLNIRNYNSSDTLSIIQKENLENFIQLLRSNPLNTKYSFFTDDDRIELYHQRNSDDFWNSKFEMMWNRAQIPPGPVRFIQSEPFVNGLLNSSFFPMVAITLIELVGKMRTMDIFRF